MKVLIGVLLILAGIVIGLWLGVWVLFIGGIIDIINQIKSPEFNGMVIAWGIVKIMIASGVGTLSAMVLIIPGFAMVAD